MVYQCTSYNMRGKVKIYLLIAAFLCGVGSMAQLPIYLKGGVGIAGDAELAYLGPNLYGGIAVKTSRNVTLDFDYQFFPSKLRSGSGDPYYYGEWLQQSFSFGPTLYFGQHIHKGFYVGAGVSYQKRTDYFTSSWTNINDTISFLTLNLRLGVSAIPINRRSSIFIELNVTGPYERYDMIGSYIEILSQLSLNIGYRIGWRKEDPVNDKKNQIRTLTKPY